MPKDCKVCPFKIAMEFKKPTLDELREYATLIGWTNFDAEYFFAKQEQTGWLTQVGKLLVPIANWKGTAMIWYKNAVKRGEVKPNDGKSFKERFADESP